MVNISTADFMRLAARTSKNRATIALVKPVERERDLHQDILDWCSQQHPRWIAVHSRTDRRATNNLGTPDFILAAPNGQTFWIECKRGNAKLRVEQQGFAMMLEALKHALYTVRSFDDFLAVVQPERKA